MVLYSIFVDSLITHRNPSSTPTAEEKKQNYFVILCFYAFYEVVKLVIQPKNTEILHPFHQDF